MDPNVQGPKGDKMHNISITKEETTNLLENLAPSKASKTHMVSARLLKETADEVATGLAMFKGGDKDCSMAENYRPISFTSVTCKFWSM